MRIASLESLDFVHALVDKVPASIRLGIGRVIDIEDINGSGSFQKRARTDISQQCSIDHVQRGLHCLGGQYGLVAWCERTVTLYG
jgi:hypothetical protein